MSAGDPIPRPLTDAHPGIDARLGAVDGVFLCADFDGTLAPIADDPDRPTIPPGNERALSHLADRPDTVVAVVSGRQLSDLQSRVGIDDVIYAGNHGLEVDRRGETETHPAAADHRPAIRRACDALAERVDDVPGCEIEDKGLTATVHYRTTPPEAVDDVRSAVADVVGGSAGDLRITQGKQVSEIRPDVDWDKGSAVRVLSEAVPADWTTIYLGDDTTDEDAFAEIAPDGIGIHVGTRTGTAAGYRIRTQDGVAPFLDWLVGVLERGCDDAQSGTGPG